MLKTKVGIIGATGYAGAELLRLLLTHKYTEVCGISSVSHKDKRINDVYNSFYKNCDLILTDQDQVIEKSEIIFASLPHGLSETIAEKCIDKNKLLIDIGADFRLANSVDYKKWYGLDYKNAEIHKYAVYSIPELNRDELPQARIIANPGCYPTSVALGLAPMLDRGKAVLNSIIIDSKSGVTGAGKGLSDATHFPECNEAFSPYKINAHRHTPEIEQILSQISGKSVKVTFVPHLLPINRGIISTIYVNLNEIISEKEIRKIYDEFYEGEKFVRIVPHGKVANLKNVKYSNYCDISLHKDSRTNRLIIVSAIDNMVKGAAGQAIQNMNIVCGFDEDEGLNIISPAF